MLTAAKNACPEYVLFADPFQLSLYTVFLYKDKLTHAYWIRIIKNNTHFLSWFQIYMHRTYQTAILFRVWHWISKWLSSV